MTLQEIAALRLHTQQICGTSITKPGQLVNFMGALQAQDFNMSKWAIGARLPGSTEKEIQSAMDKGQILRTHVLRPTWHLVSPKDIYWMLELTAPHIKTAMRSHDKGMGLTDAIYRKSNSIIERTLANGLHLTREELLGELGKARINTGMQRGAHLLFRAELDGIICSGIMKNKHHTYALLADRVPEKKAISREEALHLLAGKYFTSHGPASLKDFVWWSGLPVASARAGLESVKSRLTSAEIDSQTYYLTDRPKVKTNDTVYLMPAFDEFIISYRDRSASLSSPDISKAISNNGIFRPVIVVNGQVCGLWKRTVLKDRVRIETNFFKMPDKKTKENTRIAAEKFGAFLNLKTEIIIS